LIYILTDQTVGRLNEQIVFVKKEMSGNLFGLIGLQHNKCYVCRRNENKARESLNLIKNALLKKNV
jgi:hypothetical protein